MIRGPTSFLERGVLESEPIHVERIDECIDEADGAFLGDVVVQGIREERKLVSIVSFNMVHNRSE